MNKKTFKETKKFLKSKGWCGTRSNIKKFKFLSESLIEKLSQVKIKKLEKAAVNFSNYNCKHYAFIDTVTLHKI